MRIPSAVWVGSPNFTPGAFRHHARGVVLHVEEGTEAGTEAWFQNRSAQASSHFGIGRDGRVAQFVDTDDKAWAQVEGNPEWYSVETEGLHTEPMTDAQVHALAHLYDALARLDGIPCQLAESPGGAGLGWHGMGGAAWGGHHDCLPLDSTEVLSPGGWRKLSTIDGNTPVASWAADSGLLEFARPLAIVEPHQADTVFVAGLEMTPLHRLHVHRKDGGYHKILTAAETARSRTNWVIPAAGIGPAPGCGIGPDLMRLLVWVQADAHLSRGKTGRVECLDWHLAKERKIRRIGEVLDRLGWPYRAHRQGNGTTRLRAYGQQRIEREVLRWLPDKRWGWWLIDADEQEFAALDEEITLADGAERPDMRVYGTSDEHNADVIQALYVTHGRRAAKHSRRTQNKGHRDHYTVQFAVARSVFAVRDTHRPGRLGVLVGCLTTHNDSILIRQHGRVAVVGNCPGDARRAQRRRVLDLIPSHQGVKPMYSPPLALAAVWQDAAGNVIAGVAPDGGVFAWGCRYRGGPNGKPYFAGHAAAAIGPNPRHGENPAAYPVYVVTDTGGGVYGYTGF